MGAMSFVNVGVVTVVAGAANASEDATSEIENILPVIPELLLPAERQRRLLHFPRVQRLLEISIA